MAEFKAKENLRYYAYSREVPKEAQKQFNNGNFSGTDINPMWRIRILTEMFGPAGIGWYTEVLSERQEVITEDHTICIVDLNLYVKADGEWSKPIFGTGGNTLKTKTSKGYIKSTDEGYKMAYTDALGVACKALGIGAEIYWDKDKTKYSDYLQTEDAPEPGPMPASRKAVKETTDPVPAPAGTEPPKTVTAVVKFDPNPSEVTQDMLTAIGDYIRNHGGPSPQKDLEFKAVVKPLNNGKLNYRTIPDPDTRKKVYVALYDHFLKEE